MNNLNMYRIDARECARWLLFFQLCILPIVSNSAISDIPDSPSIPDVPNIVSADGVVYVDNTATGLEDGSLTNPWSTLQEALNDAVAGDVIYVRDSGIPYELVFTYVTVSGTENAWITIEGLDGTPELHGRLSIGDPGMPASYIHIKNVLFEGGGSSGLNINIYPNANNIVFEDIEIDCESDSLLGEPQNDRGVFTQAGSDNLWFKNFYVHHCGYSRQGTSTTDCGGICTKEPNIGDVTFINVTASYNYGDGIGGGSAMPAAPPPGRNFFYNCLSEYNAGDGFDPGAISLVVFKNSISRMNGGAQGYGYKIWSGESWVVGSVAYDNDFGAMILRPRIPCDTPCVFNSYILNNTFSFNNKNVFGGEVATASNYPQAGELLQIHAVNNIFHTFNSSSIVITDNEKQSIKNEGYNYYYAVRDESQNPHGSTTDAIHIRGPNIQTYGYLYPEVAAGGRWQLETIGLGIGNFGEIYYGVGIPDPGFVDRAIGDIHLAVGSSAVDGGIGVSDITSDIEGNMIPAGVAPDMGAYEQVPLTITSLSHPVIRWKESPLVVISGVAFHDGATVSIEPSDKITISPATWIDYNQLEVTISVQSGAKAGVRTLTVTNPDGFSDSIEISIEH